jgi:hypothetical protein
MILHPDDGKSIASDAIGHRFYNGQADGCRNRCVDGVAACFQHVHACAGCELGCRSNHAAVSEDDASSGRIAVALP